MKLPMRFLGIDPGARITGYACVDAPERAEPALVEAGCVRLSTDAPLAERLAELAGDLDAIFDRLAPTHAAVESLFSHYQRPMTAVVMGHARGIVLLAAARAGARLIELAPAEVKKAVAGHGRASKRQMQHAVAAQMRLPQPPSPPDVADAIAIALCAARRSVTAGELARAAR
jgi:crossover junction endodeoxyribonuclease RuvC